MVDITNIMSTKVYGIASLLPLISDLECHKRGLDTYENPRPAGGLMASAGRGHGRELSRELSRELAIAESNRRCYAVVNCLTPEIMLSLGM